MNNWFKDNLNSTKFRVTTTIAILSILLLMGVGVAQTLRTRSLSKMPKDVLVERIEKSPDYPLAIEQDDDAPLKILEAKVKEVTTGDFEKLTSEKSESPTIISVPEVRLLNVSDKTISRVMLVIDDAQAEKSRGLYFKELSIEPGSTFTVSRDSFVKHEHKTTVDEHGNLESSVRESMKNNKFWMKFPERNRLKVRVSVEFEDGTKWYNRNQRGEK